MNMNDLMILGRGGRFVVLEFDGGRRRYLGLPIRVLRHFRR